MAMTLTPEAKQALEALAQCFASFDDVQPGKMLHAPSLTVDVGGAHKGFVFATRDRLVMKLPRLRIDILQGDGVGQRMMMGNRQMREWISLSACATDHHPALAREAYDFVTSL